MRRNRPHRNAAVKKAWGFALSSHFHDSCCITAFLQAKGHVAYNLVDTSQFSQHSRVVKEYSHNFVTFPQLGRTRNVCRGEQACRQVSTAQYFATLSKLLATACFL